MATEMSDEEMRKELQNIQLKMNATTDEVNYTVCSFCLYFGILGMELWTICCLYLKLKMCTKYWF